MHLYRGKPSPPSARSTIAARSPSSMPWLPGDQYSSRATRCVVDHSEKIVKRVWPMSEPQLKPALRQYLTECKPGETCRVNGNRATAGRWPPWWYGCTSVCQSSALWAPPAKGSTSSRPSLARGHASLQMHSTLQRKAVPHCQHLAQAYSSAQAPAHNQIRMTQISPQTWFTQIHTAAPAVHKMI